jgi:hypothetical protein
MSWYVRILLVVLGLWAVWTGYTHLEQGEFRFGTVYTQSAFAPALIVTGSLMILAACLPYAAWSDRRARRARRRLDPGPPPPYRQKTH